MEQDGVTDLYMMVLHSDLLIIHNAFYDTSKCLLREVKVEILTCGYTCANHADDIFTCLDAEQFST